MFLIKVKDHYFDFYKKMFLTEREVEGNKRYEIPNDIDTLNRLKDKLNEKSLYVVLTVTTSCDLSCDYCFQNTVKRYSMDSSTLIEVVDAIKKYLTEYNIERFSCTLFGGEPLLEQDKTRFILEELNSFCDDNEILADFSITTNGLIASEQYLDYLSSKNVRSVQITFDGTREINNSRRRAKTDSGVDVYFEVFNNLDKFVNIFNNINIKYNFDKQNLDDFSCFLDELLTKFKKPSLDKITIIIEAIQKTHEGIYSNEFENTSSVLAKTYVALIKMALERGLRYKSKAFNTPCMAGANNSYLIDPAGDAYSCVSNFVKNEFFIGSFKDVNLDKSKSHRNLINRISILKDHCQMCDYLPGCWGGCSYELSARGVSPVHNVNCRKTFYKTFLDTFYDDIFIGMGVGSVE